MSLAYEFRTNAPSAAIMSANIGDIGDLLRRTGVPMNFGKDEEVYGQDEEADLVYRVIDGAVRTTRVLSDGRRQIGDFYLKGDIFGLETGPRHRFSAEAVRNSQILVVKASALKSAGADLERLDHMTTRRELDRALEHVLLLGRKTAHERVASFLLDLVHKAKAPVIDLPMGRQDIADYLGLTIETVSRMLSLLQSNRIVSFCATRQFRVINLDGLMDLAEQG